MDRTTQTKELILTHAEKWNAYWANPDSGETLERLVEAYLPLVHRVLERTSIHLPSHIAIEDLLQVATVGLYQAITRFEPSYGVCFEAFSSPRIRGAVFDELRAMDHVTRSCRAQIRKVEHAIAEWMAEHHAYPTEDELAGAVAMSTSELSLLLDRAHPWLSLDSVVLRTESGTLSLRDVLADSQAVNPAEEAQREDLRAQMRTSFLQLSAREQKILYLYYFEELRLSEIAKLYDVTEARICQIHSVAVARLRAIMGREEGGTDHGR